MAEKSFFFNAFPDNTTPTGYDRNYNADDISDWYSFIFENGVVKTNNLNGLKVVSSSGMNVNLTAGRGAISGKGYLNTSNKTFTIDTAPTGTTPRYDFIVLRYDNRQTTSGRKITAELVRGTTSIPNVNSLTRNDNVYELMLAYIIVNVNATNISQSNIVDTRSDEELCGWFTAVKGYEDYYDALIQRHEDTRTFASTGLTITTNLPSSLYNENYSLFEVYTNGIKELEDAYSILTNGSYIVVSFKTSKASGSKITVVLENFIDGEGMTTALNDYLQWKEAVAKLEIANEYTYVCNGNDDNVQISNIVRSFFSTNDYKSACLKVVGNIGMKAPFGGDGSTSNPYAWFNFVNPVETNRMITVDFSNCGGINPTISDGTYNVIFRTSKIRIKGASVIASNTTTGTNIRVFNTTEGVNKVEDCRFWINSYQDGLIAMTGTFVNCRGSVANIINNSYCFMPSSNGLLRLEGGEYYAYTGDSSKQSSIVGQSGANAVSILYGVSAPTSARSGFYQTNSLLQWVGGGVLSCTDLISELPMIVIAGASNIRGTIVESKTNVM